MPALITGLLGLSSLLAILLFFFASSDVSKNLSPQGCRMSWMSPSYILQTGFNTTWSPLARRYTLWLYREVGWDSMQETTDGLPVLFLPGNAGSARQVRSIASSAARQYFSDDFESRGIKPLDIFTVEFNEDLSAFHGSTLESQITYTSHAISYILSLYPSNTKIIVMGHSMGGIVAASLLPCSNISAIITMSTPFALPPARFDARIEKVYEKLQVKLDQDPTPILSLCGGASDMMITSETCILPQPSKDVFRKTVFTSALEGAWTGVRHDDMVWCHQVRWKVARAALELGLADDLPSRARVLDRWLRDGHSLPPSVMGESESLDLSNISNIELLSSGQRFLLNNPPRTKIVLLPILHDPANVPPQLTVMVSQGSILPVSPQNSIPLKVSIFHCVGSTVPSATCKVLPAETLKLIPNPIPGTTFPVPHEGSDETEGVVLYEARIPYVKGHHNEYRWVGIKIDNGDGRGWVVAGLDHSKPTVVNRGTFSLLFRKLSISLSPQEGLASSFSFPNLISNALVVYRLKPHHSEMPSCSVSLMPPLLMHSSHPSETHYFPLLPGSHRRILLHTHLEAPFVDLSSFDRSAVNLKMYSTGETACQVEFSGFDITIDWSATLGRWSSRYLNTLLSWAAGVASVVVFLGWMQEDATSWMPTVEYSLATFTRVLLRYFLPASFLFAYIPLPPSLYVGNRGIAFLTPIAPVILFIASGLVCVIWGILVLLLTICGKVSSFLLGSRSGRPTVQRGTILSLLTICAAIFLFIPWQVAFLGCWVLHLYTCATARQHQQEVAHGSKTDAVPMTHTRRDSAEDHGAMSPTLPPRKPPSEFIIRQSNLNHSLHMLLLMTWLLPFTAPVLAVWVRTLLTAGFATPFDSDHNFVSVLPFLILVDYASWTPGRLFERADFENRISTRWLFVLVSATAFVFGSRKPYLVLDVGKVAACIVVFVRIGRRYWGGPSWTGQN